MNLISKVKVLAFLKFAGLLVMLFSTTIITEISASPGTTVYVYPVSSTVPKSRTFVIEIRVSDVYDLYGWELKLGWDPILLDAVSVTEGEFLKQWNDTFFHYEINNAVGYFLADCTLLGDIRGMSGDGTLVFVEFYAEKEGSTILDLYDTMLIDSFERTIPHTAEDGNVVVSSPVGGVSLPVDKLALLAPWIGTCLTVISAITVAIVFVKYRKKKNKLSVSHVNVA